MNTANKSKNRIGIIRIPRILPNKFLLKLNKPFGEKLPGTLYAKAFKKRWS
jgi:hypothetical protein